jgi:hypothetical protein
VQRLDDLVQPELVRRCECAEVPCAKELHQEERDGPTRHAVIDQHGGQKSLGASGCCIPGLDRSDDFRLRFFISGPVSCQLLAGRPASAVERPGARQGSSPACSRPAARARQVKSLRSGAHRDFRGFLLAFGLSVGSSPEWAACVRPTGHSTSSARPGGAAGTTIAGAHRNLETRPWAALGQLRIGCLTVLPEA